MRVIEQVVVGKGSDQTLCEDMIVVTADFAAVIDGATDKRGLDFDGSSGGLLAARAIRDALLELDRGAELTTLVDAASELLAEHTKSSGADIDPGADDGPSASFVVYADQRREVWRVGDCSWRSEAGTFPGGKEIDTICANARSALTRALREQGIPEGELLSTDPGREMILPLLRAQHVFRNIDDHSSSLAFGAIDGRPVPECFLEIWPIGEVEELVLASDGYPSLEPTLELTEALLEEELAQDPLRIDAYPSTKGVGPDQSSFDDRAYLRIVV